jgi:hypothetical protein
VATDTTPIASPASHQLLALDLGPKISAKSKYRRPGEGRMLNRAAPLMAKVLAECGDGEWRTINAIAERIRKGA